MTNEGSAEPADQSALFRAPGFSAEHICIDSPGGYEYRWMGRSHYLAVHDLQHRESETVVDCLPVQRATDLRGRLTFVPAGCRISGWAIPEASKQSFTAIYFDPAQLGDTIARKLARVPGKPLLHFFNAPLRQIMTRLRCALLAPSTYDSMYLESLCLMGALELSVVQDTDKSTSSLTGGRLKKSDEQRVVEFIEANLAEDIGLDDLARIVGQSRFHFLRSFKRTTDQTPYQYLLNRRIERAQILLKSSKLSVAGVGSAVGFKETSRFIKIFRAKTGTTPRRYRD